MKSEEMFSVLQDGEIECWHCYFKHPLVKEYLRFRFTQNAFMYIYKEDCWRKLPVFKPENLEHENMWIMKEAQCLRDSAFSFCKAEQKGTTSMSQAA